MRVFAAFAIAGTLSLAACSSHALVPAAPQPAAGSAAVQAAKSCSQPKTSWIFEGACDSIYMRPKGGSAFLKGYPPKAKITVLGKFGSNSLKRSVPFTFADAIGKGDIMPRKGTPFPYYTGNAGAPFLYLKIVNGGKQNIQFQQTPLIGIATSIPLPGKTCTFSVLTSSGWIDTPLTATAKNRWSVTFQPIANSSLLVLQPGPFYSVISCK
jgi:hypothetical protein